MQEIRQNNSTTHKEIEEYIISNLFEMGEKPEQDKEIVLRSGSIQPDIYSKSGIKLLDITKPVAIEVKGHLVISNYDRELKKGQEFVKEYPDSEYWIVYYNTNLFIPQVQDNESKVKFYSYSYIQEKIKSERKREDLTDDKPQDNKEDKTQRFDIPSQETLIQEAASALRTKKCSFILGSGISVDAGAPLWDKLLSQLTNNVKNLSPLDSADYSDINGKCGWSSLITARYIVENNISEADLISALRSIIYTHPPLQYKNNPTALTYIAQIIKDATVESSITFNYDEFLEEALENIGVTVRPIYDKDETPNGEHPIYHVHGFISRMPNSATTYPVLSEKTYHTLYYDNFHWSNIELLHALIRNTCFLVGLSMSDPNLRRLLDMAKLNGKEQPRHFIFMRKEPLKKVNAQPNKDDRHWELTEQQYADLGLNIIWFDYNPNDEGDFSDLTNKLSEIYNLAISTENSMVQAPATVQQPHLPDSTI